MQRPSGAVLLPAAHANPLHTAPRIVDLTDVCKVMLVDHLWPTMDMGTCMITVECDERESLTHAEWNAQARSEGGSLAVYNTPYASMKRMMAKYFAEYF